jgi:hypothetical protein
VDGNTLDYVFELDSDTLTIWGGEKGSPRVYTGTFSTAGDTISATSSCTCWGRSAVWAGQCLDIQGGRGND